VSRSRVVAINLILWVAVLIYHMPSRELAFTILRFPFRVVRTGIDVALRLPVLPALSQENAALRAQLLQRQMEVSQLREQVRYREQERILQKANPRQEGGIVGRIIGRSPVPTQQTILINRGQRDGLSLDTVILDADGVVGWVLELHFSTALVLLITDTESRIAAMLERTRQTGLLVGRQMGACELVYLDDEADVKLGDRVITAGLSGPFPKGMVLGEVVDITRDPKSGTAKARVRPKAQLGRLEEVLCLLPIEQEGAPAEQALFE